MVGSGLEIINYNINRKNKDLLLFEFGKTYHTSGIGAYTELEHLTLYITGDSQKQSWKKKETTSDFYLAKGDSYGIGAIMRLKSSAL